MERSSSDPPTAATPTSAELWERLKRIDRTGNVEISIIRTTAQNASKWEQAGFKRVWVVTSSVMRRSPETPDTREMRARESQVTLLVIVDRASPCEVDRGTVGQKESLPSHDVYDPMTTAVAHLIK
jgi:hypothetical protein